MRKLYFSIFTALLLIGVGAMPALAASNAVTVEPGNTMWTIANANGISVQALLAANPKVNPNDLLVGTVLQLPMTTVTIKPGDTLWIIANENGVSVQELIAANPSVNPNDLIIGSVLQLPRSTTTTVTTTNGASSTISQQNMYWMEHVINAEATGETLQAQIAVGDVILHRMNDGYGSTVQQVVFQVNSGHYQFTSVANGFIYSAPSPSSIQAAKDVLDNGEDIVPGALVFYNPAQTPASSWVRTQPFIAQIDHLVFSS